MTDATSDDLWVFGYGSLMWRPGFEHAESRPARLFGWHRSLCVYSVAHRGTPERPGLVMGLDRGGACRGVAFRVPAERRAATIAYLREREQVTSVYIEITPLVRLDDGREVRALAYRVDRRHRQYAGRLAPEALLPIIDGAVGRSGANPDYVLSTHDHLVSLGIHDPVLDWLARRLRAGGDPAERFSGRGRP